MQETKQVPYQRRASVAWAGELEGFAAPMNQAAKPEGRTTIFYHQAEKAAVRSR
jgi:hypothetical protein